VSDTPPTSPVPSPSVPAGRRGLWIGLGAMAGLLLVLAFLIARSRPEIMVQWFDYESDLQGNINVDILLGARNNAFFDITVSSVDISLIVDGRQLYKNRVNRTIPMPSGELVPFPVTLDTSEEFVQQFLGSNRVSAENPEDLGKSAFPYDLEVKVGVTSPFSHEFSFRYQGSFPASRMPEIGIMGSGFQIKQFNLLRPVLAMPLEMYNPNSYDIQARNLEFDVEIFGRAVSHVNPQDVIVLPAGKSEVVSFDFEVDTVRLGISGAASIFRGGTRLGVNGSFQAVTPFGVIPVRFRKETILNIVRR